MEYVLVFWFILLFILVITIILAHTPTNKIGVNPPSKKPTLPPPLPSKPVKNWDVKVLHIENTIDILEKWPGHKDSSLKDIIYWSLNILYLDSEKLITLRDIARYLGVKYRKSGIATIVWATRPSMLHFAFDNEFEMIEHIDSVRDLIPGCDPWSKIPASLDKVVKFRKRYRKDKSYKMKTAVELRKDRDEFKNGFKP